MNAKEVNNSNPEAETKTGGLGDLVKHPFKSEKFGLIIALILIIIVFSGLTGNKYFTADNIINILISSSIVGVVVIGECYLLITGHVDLSPGSVAAFSGVLMALLLNKGVPLFLAMAIVI